jgi:hypothetical protein
MVKPLIRRFGPADTMRVVLFGEHAGLRAGPPRFAPYQVVVVPIARGDNVAPEHSCANITRYRPRSSVTYGSVRCRAHQLRIFGEHPAGVASR